MQAKADLFRSCLGWYTRLVLIGVAIEGIEFAVEVGTWIVRKVRAREERANLRKVNDIYPASDSSTKHHKESVIPTWVKFVAFVGLVLVVIGVRGELIFEDKLQIANNDIQTFDEKLVGNAAKSAKNAHDEAEGAKSDAKTAHSEAGAAFDKAGNAESRVAVVNNRAEELGTKLTTLDSQLDDEHNKRMELEKSLTPRDLPPEK